MVRPPAYKALEKKVDDLEKQVAQLRLVEEGVNQQLRTFHVLYDLATAMTSESSLEGNLQLVVDKTRELLGTETSYIALRDEKLGDVFMHSFSGIRTEAFKKARIPFGEGLGGLIAKTGRGYIIDDYFTSKELTRKVDEVVAGEGLISGIAAPIQMGKRNLGVLYAFNRTKTRFSQSDLDILFLIANLVAIEIARKGVDRKLRKARNELEQRVAERTEALVRANTLLTQEIAERKAAVEAIGESERRYRTVLDFAPYPIVVFTLDGLVTYLNPAFTEIFGWTLDELEGRRIPYVPPDLEIDIPHDIKRLFSEKTILRHETRRMTKDGRIIDVIMRATVFSDSGNEAGGELVILRDVTQEKRTARNNQAMLRISMALPEYPDLEDLLNYVSSEIKDLLGTEGGVVILLDEERQEVFFPGVAYDDSTTQKRVKDVRLPVDQADQVVVMKVIRTGEPVIVNDTSKVLKSYPQRDRLLGYKTKSFLQVALKVSDRVIGVLCAINKKEAGFDQTDVELLTVIAGTVGISIENARFSNELKMAYKEVSSLNRAKNKVFHHLSHELKTPISVLVGSLMILAKKMSSLPEGSWAPTVERAKRSLDRIMAIQYQVEDIIQDKPYKTYDLLSNILDQCGDELETLVAEKTGEGSIVAYLRGRIQEIFGPRQLLPEKISLNEHVGNRLHRLMPSFSHRRVEILPGFEAVSPIYIPSEVLHKTVDGLIRNAIENTPDEGKMEILVRETKGEAELVVRDYGVGITEENQRLIFGGFFTTQDTMAYSTRQPFDFNAGGKGADLLRMKIFSERYGFKIHMSSLRCRFIPNEYDLCPGRISECAFCRTREDCYSSGGTTFSLLFPVARR
ncbi:MAG: GAF domain-containing protein [Desulfobacterales bacterium]|nr:GAF domain-containing protein [Desulfobacterales bacterium]